MDQFSLGTSFVRLGTTFVTFVIIFTHVSMPTLTIKLLLGPLSRAHGQKRFISMGYIILRLRIDNKFFLICALSDSQNYG